MGTLADEERTFLLNATGLPADSTLADLRYAYFKGINDGTISSGVGKEYVDAHLGGLEYPPAPTTNNFLLRVVNGVLSWAGYGTAAMASLVVQRTAGGHLMAPSDMSTVGNDQYVSKKYVDQAIATAIAGLTP